MTDAIQHRGPDGEGSYVQDEIALGHRRLAIIDLSPSGHQPMLTPDNRYVLTYNGEVYNFQNLRLELEALGHTFRSRTDSEVVLAAYAQWGSDAVNRFNGMFAFAIWDNQEQTLFLARDRYGIKPLYYSQSGRQFLFGSEVKALLAHPDAPRGLNPKALLEYFTFQNFFQSPTLFDGVHLLPAGHWLKIKRGKPPQLQAYWDYCFEADPALTDENAALEELDRLFQQAVSRQLVSDVPVGAYLSGGMDSGSITAIAARQLPDMKTFTVGFDLHSISGLEMAFDEREKAEHMSYLFKTEHYEMVLKAGDMERALPKMSWHLEEPRVGQSYPNYYAAKLASKFGKVVLAGAGGDELFGGYPWRYYRGLPASSFEDYIDAYYGFWHRLIPNSLIQKLFQPIWSDVKDVWTRDIFKAVFQSPPKTFHQPEEAVNHSLYFEAKTFLHGLLVVEDKLSMAHSMETRVPFLDNDLVDFAMRLPVNMKLDKLDQIERLDENQPGSKKQSYFEKTQDGKRLLRKAMSRYIPDEVTSRAKQGFSAPDASWFKGDSIEYVKRKLFHPQAKLYNWMDKTTMQGLVQDHLDGKANRRLLIWSLLNFEHWCEHFCP